MRDERKVMFADGDSRSSTDVCSDVVSNNLKSYRSMRQLAEVGDESGDRGQARKILVGRARPSGAIFATWFLARSQLATLL